jgi:disulfide bond formation protein DsbB
MGFPLSARQTALILFLAATATVGGALVFEHGLGLTPCKLCLVQRNPYYIAMALAAAAALAPERWTRIALGLLGLVFLASAGLGIYHAGVEWGFWSGPSDCGGGSGAAAGNVNDFLNQLQTTRVVSCTEAAWRFLGLSLAGWNVLISLSLAALALAPLAMSGKRSSRSALAAR